MHEKSSHIFLGIIRKILPICRLLKMPREWLLLLMFSFLFACLLLLPEKSRVMKVKGLPGKIILCYRYSPGGE